MSYSPVPLTTFNRTTLADGNLFGAEFSQIYDNIENSIIGNSAAAPTFTMKMLYEALCPIGSITAFLPGYFLDGSNGTFTYVAAAGTLTDYFKLCDGSALSAVSSPVLGGTGHYLPNLSDNRFLMGATGYGGIGGATSSAHTHTTAGHYHGMGTGANLNITASGSHIHVTAAETEDHVHGPGAGTAFTVVGAGGANGQSWVGYGNAYPETTAGKSATHTHVISSTTHVHAAGTFAGAIGLVTGGVDGNATQTTSGASATENRPLYLACKFIMRVK